MSTDLKDQIHVQQLKRESEEKTKGTGEEITVATPQTIISVKEEMKKKVMSGEYTVGQQIAPRKVIMQRITHQNYINLVYTSL